MSIYTKTGDGGETSLFGGVRVKKNDQQVKAYGVVDELEAFIGILITKIKSTPDKEFLTEIQHDLYKVMNTLSGGKKGIQISANDVTKLEKKIDAIEKKLPKLTRFILQQGSELSAWFHIVRTVCRRAERSTVGFVLSADSPKKEHEIVIKYLNRLSDYFFVMARFYNHKKEIVT